MKSRFKLLEDTQGLIVEGVLRAPFAFTQMSLIELAVICNGCGSAQAKFDLVPDTIWGLSVFPACAIHDYEYHIGLTSTEKEIADLRFLQNMNALINKGSRILRIPRKIRARIYYRAVVNHGHAAFYSKKLNAQS